MNELHIDKTHWKRTKIGDIVVRDNEAYVFVME